MHFCLIIWATSLGHLGHILGHIMQYLVLRNRIYHYRRRVPDDIQPHVGGKRWWKQSLKTGHEREAQAKSRAIAVVHDRLIASVRGLPLPDQLASLAANIDGAEDELFIGQHSTTPEARRVTARAGAQRTQAVDAESKLRRTMIAAGEQRLDTLPLAERKVIADMGGLDAFFARAVDETNEVGKDQIRLTFLRGIKKVTDRDAEILEAALQTRARHAGKDQQTLGKLGLISEQDVWEEPDNPRINTAMEKWFVERKQGPSAVKRHRVAVRRFREMHGNLPVRDITKQMVKDYLKVIENLPDHRRLPTAQRGGLADPDNDVPRIAAPTVERHLVSIKALLKFCCDEEWLTVNVATGLKGPKDTRPRAGARRPFTREERNRVLAQAVAESGEESDIAWLVRLTAYTGARLEEIAQLARKNVREIDGVWVIEIEDLDGRQIKEDPRLVPIHPAICDDFVAWVEGGKGDRVFTSFTLKGGRYGNKLSGDFARLMDRAGLTDPRLVFHSLRHTLKREMSNARVDPDARRLILGHRPKDAHDGYAGHSLEAVASELARMPALFG